MTRDDTADSTSSTIGHLLRDLAPQVLGALTRRHGDFADAEDAVQDALIAAAAQWPNDGIPDNPRGWLYQVATRRLTDHLRSEIARRRREDVVAAESSADDAATTVDAELDAEKDDTLILLFMCCHPALTPASAISLTLRAVGGLTTAEIANAFFVPESTMAQRISRAKGSIKTSKVAFRLPNDEERTERLSAVLHILYLIFSEGYASSVGPDLQRTDLANEAIRLTRTVHHLLPNVEEVTGLLALMLLTDARRPARTRADGTLIALAEQDRALWNRDDIAEGTALLTGALAHATLGPYQLQAAIAAVHDEAPRAQDTDWPQILALYKLLERVAPNPMVTLNHAVAVAMVNGPRAGLQLLETLDADDRMAAHHRLDAVRAHLLEMAGDHPAARAGYLTAARRTTSLPEQRYLEARAARLLHGAARTPSA